MGDKEAEKAREAKVRRKEERSYEALKGNVRYTCAELFGTHLG